MAVMGSIHVQCSSTENGLERFNCGPWILLKIFKIISLGREANLVAKKSATGFWGWTGSWGLEVEVEAEDTD